ncbi:putative O-methyltransferase [Thiorhodovibrio winogradskyi]|uniref:O-methyltransferase n=1 Tax=Thiorhodovibrio winogradskyi TaxID=77007 RepID=A0ABZ0S9F6_9GAMM|nr:class I SAM-dependent methyltransferase [Thiorhodovibrio winogradskyi]
MIFLSITVTLGCLLITSITILTLHKVRKVHLALFSLSEKMIAVERETKWLYQQLQSIYSLEKLLNCAKPLPTLRGWAASPDFLLGIAQHVLREKPQIVLECSSGSSTIVLARSMQLNGRGHVYSLEHDSRYSERTRVELADQGLSDWGTVIDAPLQKLHDLEGHIWYALDQLPKDIKFDMLVIDGPPKDTCPLARYPALPALLSRLSAGASIFLDDASREDEKKIAQRWAIEFPSLRQEQLHYEKGCLKLTLPEN